MNSINLWFKFIQFTFMYNEIKMPHLAPVKLWWILLKDVSALIDSFASNVNYGVRQGFCLHWSNLLPYHSVNGRTSCWVFSLETWKFHTSEIQLVQCLEKIQKYSLIVQNLANAGFSQNQKLHYLRTQCSWGVYADDSTRPQCCEFSTCRVSYKYADWQCLYA